MKRKFLTLIAVAALSPVFRASGQATPNDTTLKSWSIGVQASHLYDLPSYRFDGEMARDLKGLNGAKTSLDVGFDLYVEKQFTPLIGAQLGFRYGGLTGANEVEYYENSFYAGTLDAIFLLSNLDLFHKMSPWNFYAKAGLGFGSFESDQYLIEDDAPDNHFEDSFWETHLGLGIQYELSNSWRLELESSYNVALNDGFDGYNYGSGSDPYLATGIGVAYTFGNKEAKPMYATSYFGENYLAAGSDTRELEKQVAKNSSEIDAAQTVQEQQAEEVEANAKELEAMKQELAALKNQMAEKGGTVAVYFDFDSAELSREAKKEIASTVQAAQAEAYELLAYADNNGSSDYNQQLKQKRAESVKQFMVDVLGVKASTVKVSLAPTEEKALENQFLDRKVVLRY